MIVIYVQKDLENLLERYILLREQQGLSREQAKRGALIETEDFVKTRVALAEDGILPTDEQVGIIQGGKKVTDKLNPNGVAL